MKTNRLASIVVGCALAGVATQAQADFQNGNFASPVVPGTFQSFTAASQGITDWTIIGPGYTDIITQSYGLPVPPSGDTQFCYLQDTAGGGPMAIEQSVALAAGSHLLTFDLDGGFAPGDLAITVYDSSNNLVANQTYNTPASPWTGQALAFSVASAGTYRFDFTQADAGWSSVLLDDLHVTGAPVPEPCTLGFFGLCAAAVWRSRR